MACISCGTSIEPFISFGEQPIANGFLTEKQFDDEYFFELRVGFCKKCGLVQLMEQPEPEQMFNNNYAFFSGTSQHMAVHFEKFASDIQKNYLTAVKDPFVVEIGSNDGIMLKHFKKMGIRHLGVEPSANVAEEARKRGINTWIKFFNEETAREIVKEFGQADAYVAANVMCHLPDLHTIARGLKILIQPKGVVAFEDPYLGDVIQKTSYDQIYDEHMCLFSAHSIRNHFAQHGFELIDLEHQETHGGSMRYYLANKGAYPISARVTEVLKAEQEIGLMSSSTYVKFRENCEKSKADLLALLKELRNKNKRVVGYAATSKSTTVINYCGITPDLVEFISDTTPLKQGKFSPGKHIPVRSHESFKSNYPEYALLFGWNHKKEIMENEKEFIANGGKWIVYVPSLEVI